MKCLNCDKKLKRIQILKKGKFCCSKCSQVFRTRNVINDFSKETEESFYWAGFLFGDGHVRNNTLSITLSYKDYDHLVKLSEYIYGFNNVRNYKKYCCLTATSESIILNLSKFGIISRKTYDSVIRPPDTLTNHFLRGFFDADGWYTKNFYKNKNGKFYKKEILGVCSYLRQNLEIFNSIVPIDGTIRKKKTQELYELRWQKTLDIEEVRRFLCGTVQLDRKWIF